jgi:hypothetical protein
MICTLHKYQSGDQIRKNEIGGHVARMGGRRGAYRDLVRRPEGVRPLARPRRRGNNSKLALQKVG